MEKLQVMIVLEVLGRPAENVQEALAGLVKKIGEEKGMKILGQTIHEPVKVKDANDLYTSFAELELELESIANYFGIIFAYMPAHIEISYPERINIPSDELNSLGNRLLQRLHDYDAVVKKTLFDQEIIVGKLKEVAPHLFDKNNNIIINKTDVVKDSGDKTKKKIKVVQKKKSR